MKRLLLPLSAAVLLLFLGAPRQAPAQAMNFLPTGDTVSDIEVLMDVPIAARLREFEEDVENPTGAFTPEVLQRLLGSTPSFIYFPEGPDPMIIPWIRSRVVADELFAEAQIAISNQDFDRAEAILRRIREEHPNTEPGERAPAEISRVIAARAALAARDQPDAVVEVMPPPPTTDEVTLPSWIQQNTTAVMITGARPIVVVGNDFLTVGDRVPRFSAVVVQSISDAEVVFRFQNQDFPVEVLGSF